MNAALSTRIVPSLYSPFSVSVQALTALAATTEPLTTSKTLELRNAAYVTTNHEVRPTDTWTNKFIFPPYEFSVPDAIVSNFHLPESTMLMSVAAFGGYEKVMNAYQSALDNDYRFGPYGDALLIV